MTAAVSLPSLPEVFFSQLDTGKTEEAIIRLYEHFSGKVLYPGDPKRLLLTTFAAAFSQRNIQLDQTGKLNMLRYATGNFLDCIGDMFGVPRLDADFAETTVRFSIAAPLGYSVPIPQGTRVTPDSSLYFATKTFDEIPAGATFVDIDAVALEAGTTSNGFVPGQINKLVDPRPVSSVANIKRSSGGVDREKDDPYRERIYLAPEAFSCAGSEQAYIFHAKSARPGIHDVAVESPVPGDVHLYVLLENGIIPEADGPEIRDVIDAVSAKKVRPLTDHVKVFPGQAVPLSYRVRYYLYERDAGYMDAKDLAAREAAASFESWQSSVLGRDINPDHLASLCRLVGIKRIEPEIVTLDENGDVVSAVPMTFAKLEKRQVASFAEHEHKVVLGGLEDE